MNHSNHEPMLEIQVTDAHYQSFTNEDGCWYESKHDVERGIEWNRRKANLIRWVCKEMGRRLSARERTCVNLYYFDQLTLREVGERTGTNATSALRAIRRATRKLRCAAREQGLCHDTRGRRR